MSVTEFTNLSARSQVIDMQHADQVREMAMPSERHGRHDAGMPSGWWILPFFFLGLLAWVKIISWVISIFG